MSRTLLKLFAISLLPPPLACARLLARGARAVAQEGRARGCNLLPQSRKLDEYGDVSAAEEKSRLIKLAAALDAAPEDAKAFIVGYAGRDARAGGGLARADRAKETLTDKSVFYNTRTNTLDCGRRETPSTELWLTPVGASPPPCSPTLDSAPAPVRPRRRGGRL